MKSRVWLVTLSLVVLVFFLGSSAQANSFIVDTGTPDESTPGFIVAGPAGFAGQQSLAFQFTVTQPSVVVTSIEGYFYDAPFFATPGTVTVALYSGSGSDPINLGPIPGTEIFSQQLQIDEVDHTDFLFGGWHGLNGLNVALASGTYWVAFEGRALDTYDGAMPGSSPFPLLNSAFDNGAGYSYSQSITDAGVRIGVPEPTSLLLLAASGLLGLAGKRKEILGRLFQ